MWLIFLCFSILSLATNDVSCRHRHHKTHHVGVSDVRVSSDNSMTVEENKAYRNTSDAISDENEVSKRNGGATPTSTDLPTNLEQALSSLENNPNTLSAGVEDTFDEQGDRRSRSTANEKFRGKIKNIKTKCKLYQGSKKLGKTKANKIVAGLSTSMAGLTELVSGIKKGDWITGLSGALRMASAVASLLGPVGTLVGTVLSLFSTAFVFFGGSPQEPPESKEDMIKRVVETAIEKSQLNELKDEVAGVVNLYTTLGDSVKHLRTITESDDDETISIAQGGLLYNHAFQELVPFGKLKEAINEYCEAGYLRTPKSGKDTESDSDCQQKDFNCKVRRNAKRCATFVRLYVKLSIQRQFLLTDMASVISDVPGLEIMYTNFLHIITKEQKRDKVFLRFLSDPINYPNRRYAVYYIYDVPTENKLLIAYIRTLREEIKYFEGFYEAPVIGCTKNMLHGTCRSIENGREITENYKSVFVPHGLRIREITYSVKRNRFPQRHVYADLVGAAIYHRALDLLSIRGCSNVTSPWKLVERFEIDIEETEARDALDEVRICSSEQEEPSCVDDKSFKYRHCRTFSLPQEPRSEIKHKLHIREEELEDDPKFIKYVRQFDNIESVHIPLNYSVTIKAGASTVTFYGPDDMNNICLKDEWKDSPEITISTSKYIIHQVKVCNDKYMGNGNKGVCRSVEVPRYGRSNIIDLKSSTQMTKCPMDVIKSLQIPKGIEVMFMKSNRVEIEDGSTALKELKEPIRNISDRLLKLHRYAKFYSGKKYLVDNDHHGPFVGSTAISEFGELSDNVLKLYRYMKFYNHLDDAMEMCTAVNCYTYDLRADATEGRFQDSTILAEEIKYFRIPGDYKAVITDGDAKTIYGPIEYIVQDSLSKISVSLKTQGDKDEEQGKIDANGRHDEL